jgi:hypothetical protein
MLAKELEPVVRPLVAPGRFSDEGCEIGGATWFVGECVSESANHQVTEGAGRDVGKVNASGIGM